MNRKINIQLYVVLKAIFRYEFYICLIRFLISRYENIYVFSIKVRIKYLVLNTLQINM